MAGKNSSLKLQAALAAGPRGAGAYIIEFLGRKDQQIKIRGQRVELGEIENRLIKHEMVKEAVVIARETKNRMKYPQSNERPRWKIG